VAPPETDDQAFAMARRIRKWIEDGRPKPGEQSKKEEKKPDSEERHRDEDKVKEKEEKQKKKGLFGWLKK